LSLFAGGRAWLTIVGMVGRYKAAGRAGVVSAGIGTTW